MLNVSVVIPTRNRPQLLRAAVQSILDADVLPAEIVVADQSTGPRADLPASEHAGMRHLRLSSTGVSRARNAGIEAATHDVLVFIDDDVTVRHDWLWRLVEALLAAPERTVVTGGVAPPPDAGHVPSTTQRTAPETFSGRIFGDVLASGNMAIRASALADVGPFDERLGPGAAFPSAEDNDLGYRLMEAGYAIAFVPQALLYHHGVRRGRALVGLDWAYARGQGAFYAKHMSLADRHMLRRFGRNAAFRLRRMPRIVRGDRGALREGVYLAGLCSGALGWVRRYGLRRS